MSDRFPIEGEPRHTCSACGCTRLVSPDGKPSVCSGIGCRSITRDLDAEQRGGLDVEAAMLTMKRILADHCKEPKRFFLSTSRYEQLEKLAARECVYRDSRNPVVEGLAGIRFTGISCLESASLPDGWSLVEMTDGTFERMT